MQRIVLLSLWTSNWPYQEMGVQNGINIFQFSLNSPFSSQTTMCSHTARKHNGLPSTPSSALARTIDIYTCIDMARHIYMYRRQLERPSKVSGSATSSRIDCPSRCSYSFVAVPKKHNTPIHRRPYRFACTPSDDNIYVTRTLGNRPIQNCP